MDLPVNPPVAPMLAKPVDAMPDGDYIFEPKWDGFRSIVFRDGDEVEIGSRNERPMTRYFPELVAAVKAELPERCVIDGEIVIPDGEGRRLDFEALQLRIHPAASRWIGRCSGPFCFTDSSHLICAHNIRRSTTSTFSAKLLGALWSRLVMLDPAA